MKHSTRPIVVVGAGLAGLIAARGIALSGRSVVVLDKGRSVGGRLATRRLGTANIDHGAQFFTVRSDAFSEFVGGLLADGLVYEWCQGFNEVDGFARFACRGGMNALARRLASEVFAAGGGIQTGVQLSSVARDADGWTLRWDAGNIEADAVLLTPPVPQSLALLDAGAVALPTAMDAALRAISYHRVLAVLATLDRRSAIPEPGARQLLEGTFSFVADNQRKAGDGPPSVTLHASHTVSGERWDHDPQRLLADLLAEARPWLGDAAVLQAELKKWRYSGPVTPYPEPCCQAGTAEHPLLFAGDAFAGPKIEGAFLSGLAAAALLAS